MKFAALAGVALGLATSVSSIPTWSALQEFEQSVSNADSKVGKQRPAVTIGPRPPFQPMPTSAPRNKTCTVKSHNDGKTDDSQYILDAIKSCNNGGHVIFSSSSKYLIGTALDLTFLQSVDLEIQGYIQFTNDTDYWQANAFKHGFQNATTFFQLGGKDVNVYGGGFIDGNGQVWYDAYAQNNLILRPILFGTIGLDGGSISSINLRYSPQWYNFVANSSNVVFDNITIAGDSASKNAAKNTDGWDTYRSNNIVIQNSVINNGDDCVSFKPNSTQVLVQGLHCNGSHGISVGSLGQYPGETDIVQDVTVYNVSMSNASDMARIKVWPGVSSELSADLQGGGGTGYVRNILYDTMSITNVDYAIELTQCYGQSNLTLCNEYPSKLSISNVTISNLSGTTSKKHDPYSGYVVCSSPDVCKDIYTKSISVTSPSGSKNKFQCGNVDTTGLSGISCTSI